MAKPGEEWRDCADWLARVGLISREHLLNDPNAKLTDLCKFLRDGVMLCKLLNLLDQNSLDLRTINQRPQNAQFLCMKNIGIFLQTCERKFDIHRDDLFEPEMLFEFSEFRRVLLTLSKLSKSGKAQRVEPEGFPRERAQDTYDDGIYETLSKDMANGPAGDFTNPSMRPLEGADDYPYKDDDIYAELCSPTWREKTHPDLNKKRDLCLQELVETESNYVKALDMLCTMFHQPLKETLDEEELRKIFGKIPELARIHRTLHEGLKEAQSNASSKTVAMVFLDHQEKLIIYGEYCANLTTAQRELEDVMANNEQARNVIEECQKVVRSGRHQLREYLVVPLQRILKYHLLLRELMRHTQSPNSDQDNLKRAYEAMMDLAEYINEVKRDNEMLQIIKDLQLSIMEMPNEINNWEHLGKLRHDGETKIECHPEPVKKRYVFVFDKVMVICSKQTRDERYVFKDFVWLENCRVQNSSTVGQGGNARNRPNSFYVIVNVNKKAYTIIAKDSDAKDMWMKNINKAIEYLNPPKNVEMGHCFCITTFTKPNTRCEICQKLLKGTIFQGYRCSRCKMVVHETCIKSVDKCMGTPSQEPHPPLPYPGYGNLQLQDYPWWADRMSRDDATRHLRHLREETFLIRWSDRHEKLVLSLKAMGEVKHMRVFRQEDTGLFYLSEARYFQTLEALITHYRRSPLSESFTELEAYLRHPLCDTALVRYPYEGTGASHLSLVQGERVIIMSREGENRGWWKGRIGSRVGYFPREYVTVETDFFLAQ